MSDKKCVAPGSVPTVVTLPPISYPENVQQAAVTAALLEIRWRLAHYEGRPMYPHQREPLRLEGKMVLERYRDILRGWWWAVYFDPISTNIIIDIRATFDGDDEGAKAARRDRIHYRRVGEG